MVGSKILRKLGVLDAANPSSYKRFANQPKSDTTYILYRGETRDPPMIKQARGFFPQPGRSSVSESGGSTSMVCLTKDAEIGATYYAYADIYFGNPTWGANKGIGDYVYAVFLPTGRGIMNYKLAERAESKNVGSKEISALVVPWQHVIGWRQLPMPKKCQPKPGQNERIVDFLGPFEENPDCNANLSLASPEAQIGLEYLKQGSCIRILPNNRL